jgi:hypothetical protein
VPPEAIWTAELLVYESEGWPPACDARPPEKRYAEQAKLVVDERPFSHRDRLRCEYPKAQFFRGDAL